MEKRDFTRVGFRAGAVVMWRGKSFKVDVLNVSLRGMLAKGLEEVGVGEQVEVTIYLSGITPEVPVQVKGVVARADATGTGIRFERMDTESFIHLRNIVAHNLGDEEKVMDEFIRFHSR